MKSVTTIFDIIVAIILIALIPAIWISGKYEEVSTDLAKTVTKEFVDKVTKNGYITEADYTQFSSDLSKTGNLYSIEFIHTQIAYEPSGVKGEAYSYKKATYTSEIFSVFDYDRIHNTMLNENGSPIYFMEIGDTFAVKITEIGKKNLFSFIGMVISGIDDYYYESATVSNMGPEYYRKGVFN